MILAATIYAAPIWNSPERLRESIEQLTAAAFVTIAIFLMVLTRLVWIAASLGREMKSPEYLQEMEVPESWFFYLLGRLFGVG